MSSRKSVLAYIFMAIRSTNTYWAMIAWMALIWISLYFFAVQPPIKVWY